MDIKKSEEFFCKMHKELSCDLNKFWESNWCLGLTYVPHSLFSSAYPHHINFTPTMEMFCLDINNLEFSVWYIKSGGNCIWKSQLIKHFTQPWTDLLLRIKGTVQLQVSGFIMYTHIGF